MSSPRVCIWGWERDKDEGISPMQRGVGEEGVSPVPRVGGEWMKRDCL